MEMMRYLNWTMSYAGTQVGSFTQFDVSESNPRGGGALGDERYMVGRTRPYRFLQSDTTPANNHPAFSETSYTFADVAIEVGTIVGTVAATDDDDDTLAYTLTGTDAANFAIDANGQITVDTELTNSQAYSLNVVADDSTDTTSVVVSVTAIADTTPANNDPVFGDDSYAFSDVALAVGTVVGAIVATDDDNDTLTYSLVGAGASSFDIDSDGEITVVTALTYGEIYDFSGRVNDGTIDVDVSVTVTAIANTAPAFAESTYSFDDVAIAVDTIVGTVAATDEDNDTITYSLTGADDDKFDIDSNGQITAAEELDYETTYNFNVVANDGTDDTSVTVSVTAEEPPPPSTNIIEQTSLPTAQYDNAFIPVAYEDPDETDSPLAHKLTRSELQDLVDAPEQVNADWDETSGNAEILNKPTLAPSNAEQNVKSNWNSTSGDAQILNKPTTITSAQTTKLSGVDAGAEVNVKSDWDATSGDSEIENKPTLAPSNAEQNVLANWDASSGDAVILNKPTVPSSFAPTNAERNVKSDWDATSGDAEILNKPTNSAGGEDNVQADWDETDTNDDAYIDNKPTLAPS